MTDDLNSRYDLIFADAVFLHFTEQELIAVFEKTNAALKSAGRLSFTVKVGDGEESTTRKIGEPRYFHYWKQPQIKSMLHNAGFSEIHIDTGKDFRGQGKPDWLYVIAIR